MPRTRRNAALAGIAAALVIAGCYGGNIGRSNAPPQGFTENRNDLNEHYLRMTDNGLLNDMNMSSVHFVPESAELNALGVRRLRRCASILGIYGGKIRYDGIDGGEEMTRARLETMEKFLASSGLKREQFSVEAGAARGTGMDAGEAALIRQTTRFQPDSTSSSPGQSSLMSTMGSGGGTSN